MKVADIDDLQEVGRLAHERDPQKYPYTHLTSLTTTSYVAGNPLYDILHDGRTVFDGPPLLALKTADNVLFCNSTAVEEWHTDMPSLTRVGNFVGGRFAALRRFTGSLSNLVNGNGMFMNSHLESWYVGLANL